jgi:DNA invertase Pin-like site-specific DNA recombinase
MTPQRGRSVAYYRVSTNKQGSTGLGLAAQREGINEWLNSGPWQLVGEFVDIESGRRAKRPQLEAALAACKKQRAKLIVAKLDRLSRNTHFLLTLIESGVDVLFCDLPDVSGAMGKFIITQMAAVAELEAGLIGAHQSRPRCSEATWCETWHPRFSDTRTEISGRSEGSRRAACACHSWPTT